MDGSFSSTNYDGSTRPSATILNNYPHIAAENGCSPPSDTGIWQDTLICDSTLPLRKVRFEKLEKRTEFLNTPMKIQRISDITEVVP